jgi:hypothetical protein
VYFETPPFHRGASSPRHLLAFSVAVVIPGFRSPQPLVRRPALCHLQARPLVPVRTQSSFARIQRHGGLSEEKKRLKALFVESLLLQ